MTNIFPEIPTVRYEGKGSKNPFAFKYYNGEEMVDGRPLSEHLRFSMSYWHTMCAGLSDPFGAESFERRYPGATPLEQAKRKADAAFEFMRKLQIPFFCFHDVDISPSGSTYEEYRSNLKEMVSYIKGLMEKTGIRLLWGTANCFSHPRYMHGAGTSCNADAFAYAAAQIKNALDATIELGGTGYVFWGGREGYETLLNTDMALEQDNMARLLKMAVEYGRNHGFQGDFLIEPKPKEPTKHQYDFDASTVLAFLRKYGLDGEFKLNLEANHATLAGHTFQHELCVARINNALGSIDANQGDPNLGWDTDQFPSNLYDATLCMNEVLQAGGLKNGGLNFDAKVRRPSNTWEDIALAYIGAMDVMALGFWKARELCRDGRIQQFLEKRYESYRHGIGRDIVSGETTLEKLEEYTASHQEKPAESGRQEYLENIVNQILFD